MSAGASGGKASSEEECGAAGPSQTSGGVTVNGDYHDDEVELDKVFINASDGLPAALTLREGGRELETEYGAEGINDGEQDLSEDLLTDEDLPSSLIVTGLDMAFFGNEEEKKAFEEMFRAFDECATFYYFKSFKRARVNYTSSVAAAKARIQLHEACLGDRVIHCYFAQPVTPKEPDDDGHLHPPIPDKQFLISPPASPPLDWAPVHESEPSINFDLIAAIANLTPGESHELHQATEDQPGIIVHVCEEKPEDEAKKPKIMQTRRPQRDS